MLALLLLPVFVRDMTSASCSLWLLVLQASVQIGYLPGVCRHFSASFATTAIMNVSCGASRKVSRSGVHSSLHQPAAASTKLGAKCSADLFPSIFLGDHEGWPYSRNLELVAKHKTFGSCNALKRPEVDGNLIIINILC